LTRKKESQVLSRLASLTSSQLADRIIATDVAVLLDSIGYFNRRVSSTDKRVGGLRSLAGDCSAGEQRE